MGAPVTAGLELLLRNTPFSELERFQLIEARREFLLPLLKGTTLPQFGTLTCLEDQRGQHSIFSDVPYCKYALTVQGLFFVSSNASNQTRLKVWGLLRTGNWQVATVECSYRSRYLKAERVVFKEPTLEAMLRECNLMPDTVWFAMGTAVRNICDRRESAFDEARAMVNRIKAEETALNLINRKLRSV